jgi:hypothetical protein
MKKKHILLSLPLAVILLSCNDPKKTDSKQELLNTFKDEKIEGKFNFETSENDSLTRVAFKNKSVGKELTISAKDTNVVLGYFMEKGKNADKSTPYRSELIKRDTVIYIEITDAAKNVIDKVTLPAPEKRLGDSTTTPPLGGFNSINDCINDFNCKQRGALQCQANRTCKPAYAAIVCCLTSGQCFSIHFIIMPTRPACWLRPYDFPDITLLSQ